ncbi:phage scaffolding protein [Paenibacillus cisolokensis]|uniref:phage scaffolding protein n=1 Tax=Paenibacillus cisolokensis TaxID=1658519 RepID=UPI003D2E1132
MDWLKELLKNAGLDESKVDALVGDVNKELPKHFVPKTQYNDVVEARKKAEKEVTDRDKQLADLKDAAKGNEDLQAQIKKLQDENKTAKEKYEAELKDLQLTTALKLALSGEVHDPDIVASLLDKSKIEIGEDGSIKTGLEDQVKGLRESKAFLFVEKTEDKSPKFKGATPADGAKGGGDPQPKTLGDAIAAHFNNGGNT